MNHNFFRSKETRVFLESGRQDKFSLDFEVETEALISSLSSDICFFCLLPVNFVFCKDFIILENR